MEVPVALVKANWGAVTIPKAETEKSELVAVGPVVEAISRRGVKAPVCDPWMARRAHGVLVPIPTEPERKAAAIPGAPATTSSLARLVVAAAPKRTSLVVVARLVRPW